MKSETISTGNQAASTSTDPQPASVRDPSERMRREAPALNAQFSDLRPWRRASARIEERTDSDMTGASFHSAASTLSEAVSDTVVPTRTVAPTNTVAPTDPGMHEPEITEAPPLAQSGRERLLDRYLSATRRPSFTSSAS